MQNYATWELQAMVKALSFCPILNSPEDNARLAAAKKELKERRKNQKKSVDKFDA
jgi:hypothetical protein